MPRNPRDYKKEYEMYHSKPAERRKRSNRNKARRKMGLKRGDGKEVNHRDGNANNNSKGNLQVTRNKSAHRRQGGKKNGGKHK